MKHCINSGATLCNLRESDLEGQSESPYKAVVTCFTFL